MKRRLMGSKLIPHIERITVDKTITVGDWDSFDLFLVGGGGSGGAWNTWGWGPGGGGAGGECVTVKGLHASPGSKLWIIVGKGGEGVSNTSYTDGNQGTGTGVIVIDGQSTYTARGGSPGLKCVPDSDTKFMDVGAKGYDSRSDALGCKTSGTLRDIYDMHGNCLKKGLDLNVYTYTNPYRIQAGVPEFHEEGNPRHAGGGACFSEAYVTTGFTEGKGEDFVSLASSIYFRGGGGYGGGGAGAYYNNSYSGAGGRGCVVLRYYTKT